MFVKKNKNLIYIHILNVSQNKFTSNIQHVAESFYIKNFKILTRFKNYLKLCTGNKYINNVLLLQKC